MIYAYALTHIAGFMAYLMFVPEMSRGWKLAMAFVWPVMAVWDFVLAFIEGLYLVD